METRVISGTDYGRLEKEGPDARFDGADLLFLREIEKGICDGSGNYAYLKEAVNRNPALGTDAFFHEGTELFSRGAGRLRDGCPKGAEEAFVKTLQLDGVIGTFHDPDFWAGGAHYDMTFRIRSRFDVGNRKSYFMAEMVRCYLEQFFDLKFSEDEIPVEEDELYDFLKICLFRQRLLEAYKNGFYKKYTYFRENDARLKGRIDVSRHIRSNIGMSNGCVAYEYRENTIDNAVNHLVLKTWMELLRRYAYFTEQILSRKNEMGLSASQILKQLLYLAPGYQKKNLQTVVREAQVPVTSLYFAEYENLRNSCLDILNGMKLSLYTGGAALDATMQSILFYVPDLWEVYVGQLLKEVKEEIRSRTGWLLEIEEQQPVEVLHQRGFGNGARRALDINRLDFLLTLEGEGQERKRLVLDAKFKTGWGEYEDWVVTKTAAGSVRRRGRAGDDLQKKNLMSDIREVLAYGELEQAEKIGVIFPVRGSGTRAEAVDTWQIGNRSDGASFLMCRLEIPDPGRLSLNQWRIRMEESREKLKKGLREKLTGKA